MSCAPYDPRDYFFEALEAEDRRRMKEHLSSCPACAAELEALQRTSLALSALPDEEIPRRIAFVSDKVFEPSPWARWWSSFWLSGARMGSAAVALLAVAILVHAFRPVREIRPAPMAAQTAVVRAPSPQAPLAADQARIDAAVSVAVAKAVAAQDVRYNLQLQQVLLENRKQRERFAEVFDAMDRESRVNLVASNRPLEAGQ